MRILRLGTVSFLLLFFSFNVVNANPPSAGATPSSTGATAVPQVSPTPQSLLTLRAVGQVGDQILTSRDVILSGVVEQWLYAIQDRPSETLRRQEKESWFLTLDGPGFREQLSRVMIDHMINMEAENFAVAEVNQLDLQRHSTRLMIDFAIIPEWKKWAPEISEVQLILKRKLRSRAFLEFKSEGSSQLVSDEEARTYFQANKGKFGPYPFEQFRKSIKEVMARDRVDQRLKEWFEVLKKKYRVRFLGPPQKEAF